MISEIEKTLRAKVSPTTRTGVSRFQPVLHAILVKDVLADGGENFGLEIQGFEADGTILLRLRISCLGEDEVWGWR